MSRSPAPESEIWSIAYISRATIAGTDGELERLLLDARSWNREHGITGVLLFSEGVFMQYFEGALRPVEDTFARIRAAHQHTEITELTHGYAGIRIFGDWQMALVKPTHSDLLRISSANWKDRVRATGSEGDVPAGLELLRGFWNDELRRDAGNRFDWMRG